MRTYIFQPLSIFQYYLIVLFGSGVFIQCDNGKQKWSINEDISRLLSSDDISIIYEERIQYDSFNVTYLTNITSSKNATSYWHLHADAPLIEAPSSDVLQTPKSTEQSEDPKMKDGYTLATCGQFDLPLISPVLGLLIHICGSLLLSSLSCIWIILISRKRCKVHTNPQRIVFSDKCRLVLGLNVHASIIAVIFLTLQAAVRVFISFTSLPPRQTNNFCNIVVYLLDICIAVFWIFVGISNTFLTFLLRSLKPGVRRIEAWPIVFKSHRNVVFLSILAHFIPWICGIALNTIHLVYFNETTIGLNGFKYRGNLLRALTTALPVAFAVITICTRLLKFQGHRLHLPTLSRVVPNLSCQHEYANVGMNAVKSNIPTAFSSHTDGAGPTCIALFSSNLVSALHLLCSFLSTAAVCLQVTSISFSDRDIFPQLQAIFMNAAVGLFYALTPVGYGRRLTLASAITTRNSYSPAEMVHKQENSSFFSQPDDKLRPKQLTEIPSWTRTQYFATPTIEVDHCEPVQFIAVYEPVVS